MEWYLGVKEMNQTRELQLELQRTKGLLYRKGTIARIGNWDYDVGSDTIVISPIVARILKVKDSETLTIAKSIGLYKEGKSRHRMQELVDQAIKSGLPWNENLEVVTDDGELVWVNTIGRPKFKDGRCARILGTVQDISEKMIMPVETAKKLKNLDYESFFDLSPAAMIITDLDSGKILRGNEALYDFTGYAKTGVLGRFFPRFISLKDFGGRQKVKQVLLEKGKFELNKVDFINKRGERFLLTIKARVLNKDTDCPTVLSVVENSTPVHRHVENLNTYIQETEAADEKLVNFTHIVSHNLKGQATNFGLLLKLWANETQEKERLKVFSVLVKGVDNFMDTIKGLREIVAIRDNDNCIKETLVLNDHIYKAEQLMAGSIKKEKVKILNEVPDDFKLKSAPVHLDSILSNLISNAITFRQQGRAPVIILSAVSEKNYTIISIEDNGIGIDLEKDGDKLFQLYRTLNNTSDARGMGLYLTKYQIELMKGRIEVESVLGEGTTFHVYFPNN